MTPRSWARRLCVALLRLAELLVAPRPWVALHSQPDLDDNVVALLRGKPADLTVRVLVDDPVKSRRRAAVLGLRDVRLVGRRSARGVWTYLRSGVVVSSHGLFGSRPRRRGRRHLCLWHGEFGKHIGALAGEPPVRYDWMPVGSPLGRLVRAAEFRMPLEDIAVVGAPRLSSLTGDTSPAVGHGRHVLWAPTYRTTAVGFARQDGDPEAIGLLGLAEPDLVELLERYDATLWYRPHPAEAHPEQPCGQRVKPADDGALEALGLTFYEMLAGIDVLVTDYSSVWVDWLMTDRPVIGWCPDLAEYRNRRGIVLEPHEAWFPGPVLGEREAFLEQLAEAMGGGDPDRDKRRWVAGVLGTSHPEGSTDACWDEVRTQLLRISPVV